MATFIRCDKCSKELEKNSMVGGRFTYEAPNETISIRVDPNKDLCVDCLCEILLGGDDVRATKKDEPVGDTDTNVTRPDVFQPVKG